ncbi:DUF5000 domain-containing lipoprotein [Niabella beijingensis]|uniref:DUF5000 domain-containing lipoprotein n=1 Tax=Niabella beijingensis TaxID=2872700 RepID=UPI001CBBEFA4|nr:DUF5000 domain-containing lipoprotein [Niabella beijingensis]MBZ4190348.1 DUF4959 domain-containing protein [Niabella beijingensis]
MKKSTVLLLILSFLLHACTKKVNEPISKSLGKPQPVTDIAVQNLPGGAVISYKIPNQEDILSVKAVYKLPNGRTFESSSSYYENKLNIMGFNDIEMHEVTLFTVNRAQELSDPVIVKIQPLESGLNKLIKTMNIISDFGGAQYSWKNEYQAPLTFEFFTPDSLGRMQLVKVITSKADSATQSIRGYDPVPRRFSVVVKDNYGNRSDSLMPAGGKITPLYEEKLGKSRMTVMKLANDQNFTNWEGKDNYIIDDDHNTFGHSAANSLPAAFTVDLSLMAKISRIVIFQRKFSDTYYNWGNPQQFDVYGRADRPSQNGDWNEWTKIMSSEIVKPSASPGGTVTDEDFRVAENGHEFVFGLDQPAMRYIRIVIRSTWGGTTFTHPADVDFYGQPK